MKNEAIARNGNAINKVYKSLCDKGFVDKSENSYQDFKNILAGGKVTKKIGWKKHSEQLAYFISELYPYCRNHKQDIWNITMKCFLDEDNNKVTKSSLKVLNKFKKGKAFLAVKKQIEPIISHFK